MNTPKTGRSRAAKQNRDMEYNIQVIGRIWSGPQSAYKYNVSIEPKEADISRIAGDFENVTDFQIIKITHGGDWDYQWTRRKVVRDWSDSNSTNTYSDLMFANED